MKSILTIFVIGVISLLATDREKLDKITNFNNYKKYVINLSYDEFVSNRINYKPEDQTNGIIKYTIEAMLFHGDEGKLEDLTKQQIDALPETPYKHFQLRRYAFANANTLDEIYFLYSEVGEARDIIRKQFTDGKIKNPFQQLRRFNIKKILMAVRTKEDKVFIIYEQDLKMPDGTLSPYSYSRYGATGIGKENGKWVQVKFSQTPDLNAVWNWSWFAYDRKKAAGSPMSSISDDANSLFLGEFKELE